MRTARLLGTLGLVLAPSIASAQEKNPFTDSWFWGAKGGAVVLNTAVARTTAPMIGADMLVTRSNFALAVGLDQAYFDAVSTVDDAPSRGVVRRVDIRDMRRLSFAMNVYPHTWSESIRPYVGLGYALNFVVRAASEGSDYASPEAKDTVLQRIQDAKSRGSVVGTLGLQINWRRYAPFVQATVMPTQGAGGKFLVNGNGFTYYIEGGLRYNFGSAIEVLR